MTKKVSKMALGLAVTAMIGTGAIAGNGIFVSSVLAKNNIPTTPAITSDVIPTQISSKADQTKAAAQPDTKAAAQPDTKAAARPDIKAIVQPDTKSAAIVTVDDNGNQTIISDESLTKEQKDVLQKDLERLQEDLDGGIKARENASPTFVAGTPSTKDLTEKNAIETARSAIVKEYALTDETLSKFTTGAMLNVVDPEAPIWSITFYPTNQNDFSQIGTYNITIDSLSGKIIKIMSAADGVG